MSKDFLDNYKDLYLEQAEQIYIKLNYRTSRAMIIRKIDNCELKTVARSDKQRYFTSYPFMICIESFRDHLLDQGFTLDEIYNALCS